MNTLAQFVILLLLLNNFALLSTRSMQKLIRLMAVQGILLAFLVLAMPVSQSFTGILFCLAVLGIKGLCFPWLLRHALRRVVRDTRIPLHIGYSLSILAGILALIFSLWLETRLAVAPDFFPFLLFPAAFTTIFTGLLLVVGRMKAISQVIGYLATENGIFLLGLPLISAAGFWFEMLILLDVLVAVFVMGLAINHIHNAFESIDVGRFCALKD